jgi:hypothetical protein
MAKRGRPPLPDDEGRDFVLTIRLNRMERASAEDAAFQAGQSVSDWVRDVLLLSAIEQEERRRRFAAPGKDEPRQ